ncbi:MAG TPA: MATE family efflux transporter, partial [Clostridia bacterium]
KVDQLTINGLILTVAASLVLSVVGFLFSPYLLALLGASGEAYAEGTRYVRGIYAGTLFFGINSTLNAFLSSRGLTKPYRNFLVFGFFLNLLLDPLLIFGWLGLPKLGTLGVAIATVIVQVVGNVYLGFKVKNLLHLKISTASWKSFRISRQLEILSQGIPAALNMMTVAIGVFVINFFIYRFGNDASTAGYGAAMRVEQLALLPAMGLNAATLTLVGQNYGAGKLDRVKETFFTALKIGIAIMTLGMILIFPLAPFLIGLFNNDPQVVFEGTRYLRIEFLAFNAYIIMNVCLSLLQGLKKPNYAVWIGVYRQLAMPLILFTFLGTTLGLGLVGVWWGIVLTTWTGALGMLVLTKIEYGRVIKGTLDWK